MLSNGATALLLWPKGLFGCSCLVSSLLCGDCAIAFLVEARLFGLDDALICFVFF